GNCLPYPLTHAQIGSAIGSTRVTVTRLMGKLRQQGLISIEGDEFVSDVRRGGKQVYIKSLQGVKHCVQNKLITGVATSVCKSNFKELVSEQFIEELIKHRVHYFWYYIYRPVGANPNPDLCLSEEEILELREFMVKKRRKFPILLIDSYWDALGNAMCPAATGISYHINPFGDIEPCPPVQIASSSVTNNEHVYSSVVNSDLLRDFREEVPGITRGCLLLENPSYLIKIKEKSGARDTTGRQSFVDELNSMEIRAGHHIAGKEIPEEYWPYKFAKKHWFFGFGAYG
ncbi:MAG: helix-turn-helix domain-containing protein, partial [Bacteroidales bacterium]|nr:helix-turn-helix domain-containing protein [Bacteroidales bacterium]